MKCYYHLDRDAVGICSQCNKAACRDCIEDIGGALLCKDCFAVEEEIATKEAKRSIMWSWVVTVVLSLFLVPIMLFGSYSEQEEAGLLILRILLSTFLIYAIWSTYWGWKVVWPWWREFVARIGTGCFLIANPLTWIFLIALFFYIPLVGAYMYGVLGGGVYQYLKYRRIARTQVFHGAKL